MYQGVNGCITCAKAQEATYVLLACFAFLLTVIGVYFQTGGRMHIKFPPVRFLLNIERGSLKVIWVTYQIISSSSYTVGIQYPAPFSSILSFLSIFSFGFSALKCFSEENLAYYTTIYLWCGLPILVALLIAAIGLARLFIAKTEDGFITQGRYDSIKYQHIWMILLLSYTVLPPVANRQLQVFNCINCSGRHYLGAETAIECTSSAYITFRSFILVFIGVYQLIPITWWILLLQRKDALNPKTASHDTKLAMYIRDNNAELRSLRFFFIDYKCDKWWFEITDMYRRIIFLGIVPLVSPNPATRASFGCMLAIMSIVFYREAQPYRVEYTNTIAHIAQYCILITFYGALSIETNTILNYGRTGQKLGGFLLVLNSIVFVLALRLAYTTYQAQIKEQALMLEKAKYIEDAQSFSKTKFNTTFEALWKHSVPASHALVFYYTSTALAVHARKSGLPALSKYCGVPLTLRSPTRTTETDTEVFNLESIEKRNLSLHPGEEVLVLSLPKRFLEPLLGFEEDGALCMISAEALNALRPTSIGTVVDDKPWLKGCTLLPPQCILKSYLLSEESNTSVNRLTVSKDFYGRSETMFNDVGGMQTQVLQTSDGTSSDLMASHSSVNELKRFSSLDDGIVRDTAIVSVGQKGMQVVEVSNVIIYMTAMAKIRQQAFDRGLVPLFHYTSSSVSSLIFQHGLRMASQGRGDGGVYVSTLGPASYGLGTPEYYVNMVKDCFGVEIMDEYVGKRCLDVVFVYGFEPSILEQAPDGRANARMVSRTSFDCLSLIHRDGNYFLRPDRILGAFHINSASPPLLNSAELVSAMFVERNRERLGLEKLESLSVSQKNEIRVDRALSSLFGASSDI